MTISLPLLILGWMLAGASPGPATLAISGTAMKYGPRAGLAIGFGVWCGSAIWGIAAALGISALMVSYAWVAESVRIVGALYLIWLGYKSLKGAIWPTRSKEQVPPVLQAYRRGLFIHLTNPKAILAWGSVYAVALPVSAPWHLVWGVFAALSLTSAIVFMGHGLLFAVNRMRRAYEKIGRWIEACFGLLFGLAGLRLLTARL